MSKLSAGEIAVATYNVPGNGWDLNGHARVTAIAIALAESGGVTDAKHKNTNGSTDYGLWQINSVHADLLKKGTWSNANDNAAMAYAVWERAGKSFKPWSTYKSGRYLAFMSVARRAVPEGSGSTLPKSSGNAGTSASDYSGGVTASGLSLPNPFDAVHAFAQLAALFTNPKTYLRIAMFGAGLMLLYMGLKASTTLDNKLSAVGRKVAVAAATKGAIA